MAQDATNTHLLNRLVANPARTVMAGFATVILRGALVLMTPAAAALAPAVPAVDAPNSVSIGDLHHETLLLLDGLMFTGGGSAGTAGGVKITIFAILGFVIWPRSAANRPCASSTDGCPRRTYARHSPSPCSASDWSSARPQPC